MISKGKFIHYSKIVVACLVALTAIGFVEKKHNSRVLEEVEVRITNQKGNFFLLEEDLLELINYSQSLGQRVTAEVMTEMEERLMDEAYVEQAEVYRDLRGKLIVEVAQSEPIARIVRPDDPDAYFTTSGQIVPVSDKYSARVLLVTGKFTNMLISQPEARTDEVEGFKQLAAYIYQHPFWKAQITQLDTDSQGNIIMYPQVGKQVIDFGPPVNLESKFARLDTFYKKILPKKGWNDYERVSVKYANQIVCE